MKLLKSNIFGCGQRHYPLAETSEGPHRVMLRPSCIPVRGFRGDTIRV